jgi:medium-chain acyl-[acyl-carrier-protein] hydrolase
MSDLELIAELRRLKGTPPEVLTNPELLALVLPIVRSDFGLTETYRYRGSDKVQCPVLAFGGWSDPEASPSEVDRWRDVTSGPFDCNLFIGDHFFFHRWSARIASIIAGNVNNTIMPT